MPMTFVSASATGSSKDLTTLTWAAQWTTQSTPLRARLTSAGLLMSPSSVTSLTPGYGDGLRSSPTTSWSPAMSSHTNEPSWPALPVTRTFIGGQSSRWDI